MKRQKTQNNQYNTEEESQNTDTIWLTDLLYQVTIIKTVVQKNRSVEQNRGSKIYPYICMVKEQWQFKGERTVFSINSTGGLPWWRSGWESACRCRGHGFEPWSGRIPHATEQLSLWATTTEPARLEPVLRNKRGRDSERPAHRDEEWPPARRN